MKSIEFTDQAVISNICMNSFTNTRYLIYGHDNVCYTTDSTASGCGINYNINLYSGFSIIDSSSNFIVDLTQLMRSETNLQIVYAMSYPTNNYFIFDESGNSNHIRAGASSGNTNTDPSWVSGNLGIKFDPGKYLRPPFFTRETSDLYVSTWIKPLSVC